MIYNLATWSDPAWPAGFLPMLLSGFFGDVCDVFSRVSRLSLTFCVPLSQESYKAIQCAPKKVAKRIWGHVGRIDQSFIYNQIIAFHLLLSWSIFLVIGQLVRGRSQGGKVVADAHCHWRFWEEK